MKKAFTLIELLVVIAIIAILGTVVISNVPSIKQKAYDSNMLTAMRSIQPSAIICNDSGAGTIVTPAANTAVCTSVTEVYPALQTNWNYTPTAPATATFQAGTLGNSNWRFAAWSGGAVDNPTKTIVCTPSGCAKTGF